MAYDKAVDSEALDGALTGIADAIRGKTGGTGKLTLEGMAAAIAGISGGSASGFNVVEGTVTPVAASQSIRIPWDSDKLPLFYAVIRQDFNSYVTPDNPAAGPVLGGIVQFTSGYARVSGTVTRRYLGIKMSATTDYTGYVAGQTDITAEILTADGLLAYSNGSAYKWLPDVTYRYYIVEEAT